MLSILSQFVLYGDRIIIYGTGNYIYMKNSLYTCFIVIHTGSGQAHYMYEVTLRSMMALVSVHSLNNRNMYIPG